MEHGLDLLPHRGRHRKSLRKRPYPSGGLADTQTHFPGPVILFWWVHFGVQWKDFVGGEKMAREQRIKRGAAAAVMVALLGVLAWWVTA